MIVADIMITNVITIGLDDTLDRIQKIFEKYKFHHLLVLDEGRLLGLISDRDVLKEISPYINTLGEDARARDTLKKKAHQIMTRKPITVSKDIPIEEAAGLIMAKNISCLPVVSEEGIVEGILSWKDILRYYLSTARA